MISYDSLLCQISELPVIDTHEHLPPEENLIEQAPDFFDLLTPYVCDDLISAGMNLHDFSIIRDHKHNFNIRWNTFLRYLPDIQHTRFFRVFLDSLGYLGFDQNLNYLDRNTAALISKKLIHDCQTGIYAKIAKDHNIVSMNILLEDYQITSKYHLPFNEINNIKPAENSLIKLIPTISSFCPVNSDKLKKLQNEFNIPAERLRDLDLMLDQIFLTYKTNKISTIKLGSGYVRSLDFNHPDPIKAQSVLDNIKTGLSCSKNTKQLDPKITDFQKILHLDDYLTWSIVKRAQEYQMDIQIHTGMHAWNYNVPSRCHADGLVTLIREFPDVRFILLHGGIPYMDDVLLLTKYYPNVILNLTWVPIIDKIKAIELYGRALDFLPHNKVQCFGGDYFYPQCIPGHLKAARQLLTNMLYKKIKAYEMATDQALEIAYKWLYQNSIENKNYTTF